MSFEDDMIEDGFQDEQDYLDYLCDEADRRLERINESVHDFDDYHNSPHFEQDERTRRRLMVKLPDGNFAPIYEISKRFGKKPLKAGHFVRGEHFDYINNDKAIIIPEQYDQVDYFREGIARCHKGRRWVLINELCEELPLNENESIGDSFEWEGKRFFRVYRKDSSGFFQGGPQGLIDEKRNLLLPTIFGLIQVNSTNRLEINYYKNIFSAPSKKTFSLDELLSIVQGPFGYLDWEKESWPEDIIPFVDGVRAIRRNDKWGFEKENGEMLIDCQFTAVQHFQEYYDHNVNPWGKKNIVRSRMLAIVEKDWCSGCIDLSGKFVFHIRENVRLDSHKPKYPFFYKTDNKLWANYYKPNCGDIIEDAVADVQVDGSMIIREGLDTFIVPAKYDWGCESGDFIDVIKDGLWGMIDKNGNEIIPCKYDELLFDYSLDDYVNNRPYVLTKNGKYGKVNNKGEEIVPFIYDDYDSLPQE